MELNVEIEGNGLKKKVLETLNRFPEVKVKESSLTHSFELLITDQVKLLEKAKSALYIGDPKDIEGFNDGIDCIDGRRPIIPLLNWLTQKLDESHLLSVPFQKLEKIKMTPCDIYIQLSQNHFVKLFKKDVTITKEDLEKLKGKKIENIYIRKEELYENMTTFWTNQFDVENFKISPDVENEMAMKLIFETAQDVGITKATIEKFKDIKNGIERIAQNDKVLKGLLEKFQGLKGTYLYNHSMLSALVGIEVMKSFSWATSQVRDEFVQACLLHDIGFDDPNACVAEHLTKQQLEGMPKKLREDVEGHILGGLNICLKSPNLSQNVLNIIKQHHFHNDYSTIQLSKEKVSNLAALMIMSHRFSNVFIQKSFRKEKVRQLLTSISADFTGDAFNHVSKVFFEKMQSILVGEN